LFKENELENVAALVLTYNRKELVKKTIDALAAQSRKLEKIFVINNGSTDGTDVLLSKIFSEYPAGLIEIVTFEENYGSSGGFARGMEYIVNNSNAQWLWIMDDDAIPERRALEKFIHYYRSLPVKKQHKVGILQNERIADYEKFKQMKIPVADVRGKLLFKVTFEGYLIKREVIETIGFPRQEFFIYSDDIEYTWRAIQHGYRVHRVCGSLIFHQDWARVEKVNRGIIVKPNIPPWKLYYLFRNPFLVCENYPVFRFFIMIVFSINLLLWSFINQENAYFAKRGLTDGINLVSGKIVSPESVPVLKE
jgi:GT2 family glycosyltransferase